ncbi:hypothetical protein D9756_010209 [Leucocoprinus leucothites]|uniref:Uncharacterized protein n=1 Tax=Leucocoprinus leucothites TaxID=201217 RepID=A0A8H5FSV4_9AGAR|nr:hypothetical protein D9756_010209 [Leucoagaricus leucothites]
MAFSSSQVRGTYGVGFGSKSYTTYFQRPTYNYRDMWLDSDAAALHLFSFDHANALYHPKDLSRGHPQHQTRRLVQRHGEPKILRDRTQRGGITRSVASDPIRHI